jgi:hypothetical protein
MYVPWESENWSHHPQSPIRVYGMHMTWFCLVPWRDCLRHCYHHPSTMQPLSQCLTPCLLWTRAPFVIWRHHPSPWWGYLGFYFGGALSSTVIFNEFLCMWCAVSTGVGRNLASRLHAMGVYTCSDLQHLSQAQLKRKFREKTGNSFTCTVVVKMAGHWTSTINASLCLLKWIMGSDSPIRKKEQHSWSSWQARSHHDWGRSSWRASASLWNWWWGSPSDLRSSYFKICVKCCKLYHPVC